MKDFLRKIACKAGFKWVVIPFLGMIALSFLFVFEAYAELTLKQTFKAYIRALNAADASAVALFYAEDAYLNHKQKKLLNSKFSKVKTGRDEIKKYFTKIFEITPSYEIKINDILQEMESADLGYILITGSTSPTHEYLNWAKSVTSMRSYIWQKKKGSWKIVVDMGENKMVPKIKPGEEGNKTIPKKQDRGKI